MEFLLLKKRVPEKGGISGQNMVNGLKLNNSKSNVFSNFEGNTVSCFVSLSKLACFILFSAVGL